MTATNVRARKGKETFPAARASGCVSGQLRQTLKAVPPGGASFGGEIDVRINPFTSLFAASLIAFLPAHALAQTETDEMERLESVSVQDRDRPEYDAPGHLQPERHARPLDRQHG